MSRPPPNDQFSQVVSLRQIITFSGSKPAPASVDTMSCTAKGEGSQPLVMRLTQRTSPRPDFEFHELAHPAGRVVVLAIKAPRSAPLAFGGVRYIRIDSHKTKLAEHPDKELRIWELLGCGHRRGGLQ